MHGIGDRQMEGMLHTFPSPKDSVPMLISYQSSWPRYARKKLIVTIYTYCLTALAIDVSGRIFYVCLFSIKLFVINYIWPDFSPGLHSFSSPPMTTSFIRRLSVSNYLTQTLWPWSLAPNFALAVHFYYDASNPVPPPQYRSVQRK